MSQTRIETRGATDGPAVASSRSWAEGGRLTALGRLSHWDSATVATYHVTCQRPSSIPRQPPLGSINNQNHKEKLSRPSVGA
ncbi:hypothetical protein Cci01nite_11750 [Catellatospora citrea]|uniref:Uncharacterized protein n=1 Tax=Catellatospora citrea TaxID=53366 RepID=A0A8J3K3J2_9ACTN|nr:hypothetical protein Cci01nite_11750 [Catellatospora citrea]